MTENEIIEYLKQNKTKGVAFIFMPKDVQNWCNDHRRDERTFMFYNGIWIDLCQIDGFDARHVYSLLDDYEPKAQFEPYYEEFEIDKEGFFHIKNGSDTIYYCWYNWQKFLDDNFDKYNNFGGWVYETLLSNGEKIEILATFPRFLERGKDLSSVIILNAKNETKPAYPTKILFWRYKE